MQQIESSKHSDQDISVLPLESLKLPPRKPRLAPEHAPLRLLHLTASKSPTPARVTSAKKLVFRGSPVRYASEEKGKALEETRMLARERRLSRAEMEKKMRGLVSPRMRDQQQVAQQLKKFRRSEERKLLAETKKFKRIKEKPDEQQIAMREKIMKKLMEDPKRFLSGIAENEEELLVSHLETGDSKALPLFPQTVSEVQEESSVLLPE